MTEAQLREDMTENLCSSRASFGDMFYSLLYNASGDQRRKLTAIAQLPGNGPVVVVQRLSAMIA